MPRARLSVNGPELAMEGYDVDTAPLEKMLFSPAYVAMRVAKTGVVTPGSYTGDMDDYYKRSVVEFDNAFPAPPIVLVAGINIDGSTDQSPVVYSVTSGQNGWARSLPLYEIRTFTSRFELYVLAARSNIRTPPSDWRYWVFQNTLDT